MKRTVLLPPAAADVEDAYWWYEDKRAGLGEEFAAEVQSTLAAISADPLRFPVVHRGARRAFVERFPYSVVFRVVDDIVVVAAVFHARMDPRRWRERM